MQSLGLGIGEPTSTARSTKDALMTIDNAVIASDGSANFPGKRYQSCSSGNVSGGCQLLVRI